MIYRQNEPRRGPFAHRSNNMVHTAVCNPIVRITSKNIKDYLK